MQLVRCTVADLELIREMQKEAFAELLKKYQDHDTCPANETVERITMIDTPLWFSNRRGV